ncbi:hypothetical protein DM860_014465 [Cuscuta australis]|uniref:Uncharacterized protein n=1 Tax=Cuscuta australis TaxID=267555 RepID=A0A328E245_9ASTE|nr:hypothetical protein DM860_014465 [Cuscuta australis]
MTVISNSAQRTKSRWKGFKVLAFCLDIPIHFVGGFEPIFAHDGRRQNTQKKNLEK